MGLKVYKKTTLLERISYRFISRTNGFILNEMRNIRRYYRDNSLEGCHDELKPVLNDLYSGIFGLNMFYSDKTSEAMKPSKTAAKRFCLLSLAHMTSKLTRNSENYPEDVINEIKALIGDIEEKARKIQDIEVAPMEPFVDSVKSVFNADRAVTDDNYNRVGYVRDTRDIVKACFGNPNRLGYQDVDNKLYKDREIEPGDIRNEDIDFEYNRFLRKISGNMFGVDSPGVNKAALDLLNLINGKDEQNRKEIKDFNKKYPVELADGTKTEFDPLDLNNFGGIKR